MLTQESIITVYNEHEGRVYCPSQHLEEGYTFREAEGGIPFEIPMTLREIKYINSRSAIFRDEILKFQEDLKEEVFKNLGIIRRASDVILSNEEIEDIILNPTSEKLEKILQITSSVIIEKVRSILVRLNNTDEYDISVRVFDVINGRYAELSEGKRKSEIVIKKKKNEVSEEIVEETKKPGRPKTTK